MYGKITLISPDEFLEEFIPRLSESARPAGLTIAPWSSLSGGTNEARRCEALIAAFNRDATILCPGYELVATISEGNETSDSKKGVNCGLYPKDHVPHSGVDGTGKTSTPAVDWSNIAIPIEVMSSLYDDPFGEDSHGGGNHAFGQISAHAQTMFDYQQLIFIFMVVIVKGGARLLRIDRSGIIATTKFNHKTSGDPLLEFLWRYARLSPELQGQDTTAERVPHDSPYADLMREKLKTTPKDYVLDLFEASLDEDRAWWLLKLTDERTKKDRRYLVGKPHFAAQGVAGRGTRGYVALDADDPSKPLVYLKDSWRVLHDEIRKEGAVLELLNANDVLYVPTLVCHGDLGQKTTSEDVWRKFHPTYKTDDPYPLKQHGHYRLVVEEVGKPLEHFANGLELILALCCCLIAHAQAYTLGIIHRDISAGNILLYPAGNGAWSGILNDWELAKEVHSASPMTRQPNRTGTWQFLSARALNLPDSEIIIQDELESVFHVLLYMAIRYLPHNCAKDNVGALLYYFFDDCHIIDKKIRCGMTKMHSMKTGEISIWQKDTEIILEFYWQPGSSATHPIGELLRELLVWFKAYYAATNSGHGASAKPALQANPVRSTAATLSLFDRVDVAALFGQKSSRTALAQSAPKPTGRDTKTNQEIADKLRNHVAMIKLFQMYLDEKSWPAPGVDKTKDQRPKKGFNPSDHIRDSRTLAKASKRPADDDDAEPVTPPSKHRRTKVTE